MAAFRWLRANAAALGGDPARIGVSGESAGGNAAATSRCRMLAAGEAPPEAVALLCPWLDLTMSTPSSRERGPEDPVIDDAVISYWRSCYAPDARLWSDPDVSPMFADVASFPPACVVTGGSIRCAMRASPSRST